MSASCCHTSEPKSTKIYNAIAIVIIAFLITFLLIYTDILWGIQIWALDNSLWMILLLWLVGSFSTCLAMTWWVIMWCTELVDLASEKWANTKFHLYLHAGRLVAFFVFGCLLGLIWETFIMSLWVSTWMSILIAIMFVYISLYLLWVVKIPTLSSWVNQVKIKWRLGKYSGYNIAPIIGALTFLIPCGFTQSTQMLALASGSRYMWGLMMFVYALWNTPGLLLLWLWTSYAKTSMKASLNTAVATVLMVFGMFTLRGSASVLWWTQSMHMAGPITDTTKIQKITLSHNGYGLIPKTTRLEKWKSYEITIMPSSNGIWCKSRMILPGIDTEYRNIQANIPISYTLYDVQPWAYSFVCSSWSAHGSFVVEDV